MCKSLFLHVACTLVFFTHSDSSQFGSPMRNYICLRSTLPAASVVCRVGMISVPATVRSATRLQCFSPSNPPGFVTIEITKNFQDFSNSGNIFLYHLVSVLQVQPHFTSQLGGEEIKILGTNFLPSQQGAIFCLLGACHAYAPRMRMCQHTQDTRHS